MCRSNLPLLPIRYELLKSAGRTLVDFRIMRLANYSTANHVWISENVRTGNKQRRTRYASTNFVLPTIATLVVELTAFRQNLASHFLFLLVSYPISDSWLVIMFQCVWTTAFGFHKINNSTAPTTIFSNGFYRKWIHCSGCLPFTIIAQPGVRQHASHSRCEGVLQRPLQIIT